MCGLIGYVGKPIRSDKLIKDLIYASSSRGTDGYGYMAYRDGMCHLYKEANDASKSNLEKTVDVVGSTIVLGHTRAATSGTRGVVDCHPLVVKDITVIHNGCLSDNDSMRRKLEVPDNAPTVDSYLIPWIISREPTILEGIKKVFTTLEGSLTFLAFSKKNPMNIWAASNFGTLYHFRYNGADYFASTKDIFWDCIIANTDWGQVVPAHKASYLLRGIYTVSPYTIRTLVDNKGMDELRGIRRPIISGDRVVDYGPLGWKGHKYRYGYDESGRLVRTEVLHSEHDDDNTGDTGDYHSTQLSTRKVKETDKNLSQIDLASVNSEVYDKLSKKQKKRLAKVIAKRLSDQYNTDDEEVTILGSDTNETCDMCKKKANAIYQEVTLCFGCLNPFFGH